MDKLCDEPTGNLTAVTTTPSPNGEPTITFQTICELPSIMLNALLCRMEQTIGIRLSLTDLFFVIALKAFAASSGKSKVLHGSLIDLKESGNYGKSRCMHCECSVFRDIPLAECAQLLREESKANIANADTDALHLIVVNANEISAMNSINSSVLFSLPQHIPCVLFVQRSRWSVTLQCKNLLDASPFKSAVETLVFEEDEWGLGSLTTSGRASKNLH